MHLNVTNFNLKHTIESGQFFHYTTNKEGYLVVSHNNIFKIRQEKNRLITHGVHRKFVQQFLALNHDFDTIKNKLCTDHHLKKAYASYNGMRILEQDPWETLIAFICSSASNIPKITMNVTLLAQTFGKPIHLDNETAYTLPTPGELNDLEKIKSCKVGFRAKYLFAANKLHTDFFDAVKKMDYQTALTHLTTIDGVGEKIADCVLLFGCKRLEAFPVDVWIKRVMQELYFNNKELPIKNIKSFGTQKFGAHAGYANQYLFHWRRNI